MGCPLCFVLKIASQYFLIKSGAKPELASAWIPLKTKLTMNNQGFLYCVALAHKNFYSNSWAVWRFVLAKCSFNTSPPVLFVLGERLYSRFNGLHCHITKCRLPCLAKFVQVVRTVPTNAWDHCYYAAGIAAFRCRKQLIPLHCLKPCTPKQ